MPHVGFIQKGLWLAFVFLFSFLSAHTQIEFVENKGQWPASVHYKSDWQGGAFFLEKNGFTAVVNNADDLKKIAAMAHPVDKQELPDNFVFHSFAYKVIFLQASSPTSIIPEKPLPTYNNYFIGDDPSRWASACRIFGAVVYKNIYPGIDVRYYGDAGSIKYDFIIHPGANPNIIALQYEGPDLKIVNKELLIQTSVGLVKELEPYAYQPSPVGRAKVAARYELKNNIVRFQLRNYDPQQVVIIDPSVIFCSFTGSSTDNWGYTATPGPDGSMFAGGISFGVGYPTSTGAFQTTFSGGVEEDGWVGYDIALFKFSPTGANREYATYLGGTHNEQPHSMIVDNQGCLIVAGRTLSDNFPKRGLGQVGSGGGYDIIVTKFNPSGTDIIGSVKIGGSSNDGVNIRPKYQSPGPDGIRRNYGDDARSEVILNPAGDVILSSCTQSRNFPVQGPSLNTSGAYGGGRQDGLILKFNANLNALLGSSYFGGNGDDACFVIDINPANGNLYVAGATTSTDLPGNRTGVLPGGNGFQGGITDGYITQLNANATAIIKTAYLGTPGTDMVYGLKFDKIGFPYVMGTTTGNWPIRNVAFSQLGARQFISKLQPDFSAYVYSTVFGTATSQPNISPIAFLVDRCENVYVSGWGGGINNTQNYSLANTRGMSAVNPLSSAFAPDDGQDFYFFVLERNGQSQLFGSSFGQNGGLGDHVDGGTSRFDKNGVIYQAMCANCGRNVVFPTTPGVWASSNGSNSCNEAVVKIEMNFSGVAAAIQTTINAVRGSKRACVPFTVFLSDSLKKGKKYYWYYGDGRFNTTTAPSDSVRFTTPGDYTIMLIAEDSSTCNIRDTSYVTIRAGNNSATPDFSFVKLPPCQSLTYSFSNTTIPIGGSFGPASFIWDFGDGSPPVIAGAANPVLHTFPAQGSYNVTLKMVDSSFCNFPDETIKTVRISANVQAGFTTSPTGCVPYTAVFQNTSSAGTDFYWDFGDGTFSTNSSLIVNHTYPVAGTYQIRLIATDTSTCNKSDTSDYLTIQVFNGPDAEFTWSPNPPVPNTQVQFSNLSQGAVRYVWNFGDGESSQQTNPVHLYNQTGAYAAELIAYNDAGCPDTFKLSVNVIVNPLLDVPNAFTPGSFGQNSSISVRGFGIKNMVWRIYNRWGQIVFESRSLKQAWDGTYKGKIQPMDVYTYTLDAELTDGQKIRKTGDITLIR